MTAHCYYCDKPIKISKKEKWVCGECKTCWTPTRWDGTDTGEPKLE